MRLLRLVLIAAMLLPLFPRTAEAVPKTLIYTGSLKDEKGGPIGGIYWFRYALHRTRNEQKMLWSEEMYVAIDSGNYQVELGKERPIPQALDLTDLYLSVTVDGHEISRTPIEPYMISGGPPDQAGDSPAGKRAAPVGAETCKHCQRADRAADAERLGGMSVKQVTNLVAKKQVQVGTAAHFTSTVGSGDGSPFRLSCPPGFVVTGIKGKADEGIANLQLVCSPLETK